MKQETRGQESGFETERFLRVSECFLRHRLFGDCRKYAIKAQESSPNHHGVPQILAVADVFLASQALVNQQHKQHDWYSVLQVSRYSKDSMLIRANFKKLCELLNPNQNKFTYAADAFTLVLRAWSVLSNPSRKSEFDNGLRNLELENSGEPEGNFANLDERETFWTICPYCYYAYEYDKVYEDCCLRCHNEECKRGFHVVAICSLPAMEVVEKGWYWCYRTFSFRFEGNEGDGLSGWTSSVPGFMQSSHKTEIQEEKNTECENGNEDDKYSCVEISDDSDDSTDEIESERRENIKNVDAEKVGTEEVNHMRKRNFEYVVRSVDKEVSDIRKPVMKRKKSVANSSMKLMGKGIKVNRQRTVVLRSIEGLNSSMEAIEDDKDIGHLSDGGTEMESAGGDNSVAVVELF